MEILQVFCDQTGCATDCLYTDVVMDALLDPLQSLLNGAEVCSSLQNNFQMCSILYF